MPGAVWQMHRILGICRYQRGRLILSAMVNLVRSCSIQRIHEVTISVARDLTTQGRCRAATDLCLVFYVDGKVFLSLFPVEQQIAKEFKLMSLERRERYMEYHDSDRWEEKT